MCLKLHLKFSVKFSVKIQVFCEDNIEGGEKKNSEAAENSVPF